MIGNRAGRVAISKYSIPPFVDGSCRREPDLESKFPSISALCRFTKFAPRIHEGDIVVYITKKGQYLGVNEKHWRLTAILEILKRFQSHPEAAEWYQRQGILIPSNCMINGNPPLPLDKTVAHFQSVEEWDLRYRKRASECGVFLACKPLFIDLNTPPIVKNKTMIAVFGKIMSTRNPPAISHDHLDRLRDACLV